MRSGLTVVRVNAVRAVCCDVNRIHGVFHSIAAATFAVAFGHGQRGVAATVYQQAVSAPSSLAVHSQMES